MKSSDKKRALYYRNNLLHNKALYKPASILLKQKACITESKVCEYVLIPFFFSYVLWILEKASRDGIEKLYFLSRDGYYACQIAKLLCDHYSLDIECRYLYCSRYSLRIPMYSQNIDEMLDNVCRGGLDVSLKKILLRSGFNNHDIKEVFPGLDSSDLRRILSESDIKKIRLRLKNNSRFINKVKEISNDKWPVLQSYFLQEGLLTNEDIGLVDSGWIGSIQKTINDIREREGCYKPLKGYYLGLYNIPRSTDSHNYFSCFFSPTTNLKRKILFNCCLVEAIFSAPHGSVIGYYESDQIKPLVGRTINKGFFQEFSDSIMKYTANYLAQNTGHIWGKAGDYDEFRPLEPSILKFMSNPTRKEADYFGNLDYSDDLLDDNIKKIAASLTEKELLANHLCSRLLRMAAGNKHSLPESAWLEGTANRSSKLQTWHRFSYHLYKALRTTIINLSNNIMTRI